MGMDKPIVYKELENIYTACMSRVIASACEKAWGGLPEGAFGKFCALDRENTDKENAERDQRRQADEEKWRQEQEANPQKKRKKPDPNHYAHISPITTKADCFEKFDFQACNNTFLYLNKVVAKIYTHYKINQSQQENVNRTVQELARLRNKLAHLPSDTPPEAVAEIERNCLNQINVLFGLGFQSVTDQDGKSYYERFQKGYLQYMDQQLQRWYYLAEHLDLTKYDVSRFLEVCANNGIEAAKKDGKYLFRTAHPDKTLELLQNALAIGGDRPLPPAAVSGKKSRKWWLVAPGIVLTAAILVGAATAVLPLLDDRGAAEENGGGATRSSTTTQSATSTQSTTERTGDTTTQSTTSTTVAAETNQIPAEHQNAITAFRYASVQTQENLTVTVAVGGYVTPPLAMTWENATIYSENTAVAIGEGMLVKGVSPGTTYLLIESEYGTTLVYRVIVQ